MFLAACQQFVNSMRKKDTLIPAPSLDEQDNVKFLQLVVMKEKPRFFYFTKWSYHPTDFQLTDVLQDSAQISEKRTDDVLHFDYENTIEFSWKGKVGFDLFPDIKDDDLIDSDTWKMQVKFGKVVKTEVDIKKLMEDLMKKKLNLHHPFIEQVKENERNILCLVTGVVHSTDTSVQDAKAEASGKMLLTLSKKNTEVKIENNQVLGLERNTVLAYSVHKLDDCFIDGSINLVPIELHEKTFIERHIDFQYTEEVFQAILDLPEKDRNELTSVILKMMSVPRDIQIFTKLVEELTDQVEELTDQVEELTDQVKELTDQVKKLTDQVEELESQETQNIKVEDLEKQFLTEKQSWLYLLKLAGITVQASGELSVPREVTPLLKCFGVLFDALSGLQDEELDLIRNYAPDEFFPILYFHHGETFITDWIAKMLLKHGCSLSTELIRSLKEPSTISKVYCVMFALWFPFIKI